MYSVNFINFKQQIQIQSVLTSTHIHIFDIQEMSFLPRAYICGQRVNSDLLAINSFLTVHSNLFFLFWLWTFWVPSVFCTQMCGCYKMGSVWFSVSCSLCCHGLFCTLQITSALAVVGWSAAHLEAVWKAWSLVSSFFNPIHACLPLGVVTPGFSFAFCSLL